MTGHKQEVEMASRARQKERQRQKRAEKRRQLQRSHNVSPYRMLQERGGQTACYINGDWRDKGMASLMVLRRHPHGGYALAGFLIDTWCMGLKDAWGRLDLGIDQWEDYLQRRGREVDLVRIPSAEALRLLRGGIRFAQQNGFRLPHKYQRWTSVVGDLGPVSETDLSDFGKDGRLVYTGDLQQLYGRLIGCSPEDFLNREDVRYVVDLEVDSPEDEVMPPGLMEHIKATAERTMSDMRPWLAARGEQPHSHLKAMVSMLLMATAMEQMYEIEDAPEASAVSTADLLNRALADASDEDRVRFEEAFSQFHRYTTDPARTGSLDGAAQLAPAEAESAQNLAIAQ